MATKPDYKKCQRPPCPRKWGEWEFSERERTLKLAKFGYYIDLMRCTNGAEMLDWIMQVNGKRWASARIIKDMLNALRDILQPQATFCGLERDEEPPNILVLLIDYERMSEP